MRIAVFPGSFDPLHIGHQAIMEHLTQEKEFDWVYLIISPQNPFKDPSKALNARQRYEDAVAAVRRHPELHVWVDDIELGMEPPHYTIRTLDALRRREPGNDFTLVMGADNLSGIMLWRNAPRILGEYGVAVYPREGYDLEAIRHSLYEEMKHSPAPYVLNSGYGERQTAGTLGLEEMESLYNIQLLDAPRVDISSSIIREAEARGEDMSKYRM